MCFFNAKYNTKNTKANKNIIYQLRKIKCNTMALKIGLEFCLTIKRCIST